MAGFASQQRAQRRYDQRCGGSITRKLQFIYNFGCSKINRQVEVAKGREKVGFKRKKRGWPETCRPALRRRSSAAERLANKKSMPHRQCAFATYADSDSAVNSAKVADRLQLMAYPMCLSNQGSHHTTLHSERSFATACSRNCLSTSPHTTAMNSY
jgi:hypothetical protein